MRKLTFDRLYPGENLLYSPHRTIIDIIESYKVVSIQTLPEYVLSRQGKGISQEELDRKMPPSMVTHYRDKLVIRVNKPGWDVKLDPSKVDLGVYEKSLEMDVDITQLIFVSPHDTQSMMPTSSGPMMFFTTESECYDWMKNTI